MSLIQGSYSGENRKAKTAWHLMSAWDSAMCEFRVILDGEKVFEDAIYVKDDGQGLLVRDVLGQSKKFPECRVVEISVEREELIIAKTQH